MTKRKFFYDSIEDSHKRLTGTVVLLDKEPVYINAVSGLNTDQIADYTVLPFLGRNVEPNKAPLIPSRFSIRSLPSLGYIDFKDFSYYCMRIPSRQNKQGYCRANVQVLANPNGNTPNWDGLLQTKSVVAMFKDQYPSFVGMFDKIVSSDTPLKKAFAKTMALEIDDMESVSLEHRGMKVAIVNNPRKYGPVFRLPNKFRYLAEELQEYGIRTE